MRDITSPGVLWGKAGLFVVSGAVAAGLLLAERPTLRTLLLLLLAIWSFARAYYFAFYVIEHYIDPEYRYSGLWSALAHLRQMRGRAAAAQRLLEPGRKSAREPDGAPPSL
ncbi:MAG: hypothetical protein ACT4QC_14930 [Planctomycetaceae bacterium]